MLGVDKLDITKFFNVPNSLNNLSVGKLNTVPIDLKNFSDVADNQVVKNTKFNTLKAKIKKLDKKILL